MDGAGMSPVEKYRCKKITQHMIDDVKDMERDVYKYEAAAQLRLMIRDGLSIDMLSKDEYNLMVDIYGHDLKTCVGTDVVSIDDAKKKFERCTV